MAWLYAVGAVVLLPWIVYLAISLPRREFDAHYRGAWVGFDVALVLALVATAYYAFRADSRVVFPATVTSTLLVVDAWFDILTSGGRKATFQALLLAAFFELPAAYFSIHMAHRITHEVRATRAHPPQESS